MSYIAPSNTILAGGRWANIPYPVPSHGSASAIGLNTASDIVPGDGWTTTGWNYSLFNSFGGGAFLSNFSDYGAYVLAGTGGHAHPDNPGAVVFDFEDALWKRLDNANGVNRKSNNNSFDVAETNGQPYYELTGTEVPAPPHPYANLIAIPDGAKGRVAYITRAAACTESVNSTASHQLDLNTLLWSRLTENHYTRGVRVESDSVYDAQRNCVWHIPTNQHEFKSVAYLDLLDGQWKTTAWSSGFPSSSVGGIGRCVLVNGFIVKNCGSGGLWLFDPYLPESGWVECAVSGALPAPGNRIVEYSDGNFYSLPNAGGNILTRIATPNDLKTGTWVIDAVEIGGPTIPSKTSAGGFTNHYSLLCYVPRIDCLSWLPGEGNSVYLIKPPVL